MTKNRFLYSNSIPEEVSGLIKSMSHLSNQYAYLTMKTRSYDIKAEFFDSSKVAKSFALQAAQRYLDEGIDHVIMGLRKKEYVDDIRPFI